MSMWLVFFFNDTATTEIYTLSLHDALPIFVRAQRGHTMQRGCKHGGGTEVKVPDRKEHSGGVRWGPVGSRSEEHTSELQSRLHLGCRPLLEKKKERLSREAIHGA